MYLKLFIFFHINIFFSSIEEKFRPEVINKCYWPLLRLIKKLDIPIGIEASAITLQIIKKIDPSWAIEFKDLLKQKKCELIGSGYAQIIGPLVPAKINLINLKLGNQYYKKNFDQKPISALINEQAYSSGLISHYINAGFKNIIMEWNNSALSNKQKNEEIRYCSQKVYDNKKRKVDLVWNNSIIFQKFQRYAHGEINLDHFYKYLKKRISKKKIRTLSLYGNDAEVFDYRPGRFKTEEKLNKDGEWNRIEELLIKLKNDKNIEFIKLSEVPKQEKLKHLKEKIKITSEKNPIVVKKQEKYNILRWAVTGRNDTLINTICWSIYKSIIKEKKKNYTKFKELCYLWSSDFRTHITEKRWKKFLIRLKNFSKTQKIDHPFIRYKNLYKLNTNIKFNYSKNNKIESRRYKITENYKFLQIDGKNTSLSLNKKKGFAIEYFKDFKIGNSKLFGTIEHGYFDDIRYSADYFSGNLVYEPFGKHKITDLESVNANINYLDNKILIETVIKTSIGKIYKTWVLDDLKRKLTLKLKLKSRKIKNGSLRFGHITLIPKSFDKKKLSFETHNGGSKLERFKIDENFDHNKPVSNLISANHAIGVTEGVVVIGDNKKKLKIKYDNSKTAVVGLLSHKKICNEHLTRVIFSSKEIDDTSKYNSKDFIDIEFVYSFIK
jgi:hypothetical protein